MKLRRRTTGVLIGLLSLFFSVGLAGDALAGGDKPQYPPKAEIKKVVKVVKVVKAVPAKAVPQKEAQAVSRKGGLAETGNASVLPLAAAGAGLMIVGAFAVTATRRRRTAQAIQP